MLQQIDNLIKLYLHVCDKYKKEIGFEVQRFSNNGLQGAISDEELITIYLFCVSYEQKHTTKSMYNHIKTYWHSWFPTLPSYQTFNDRLNRLCDCFIPLMTDFFNAVNLPTDSLTIIMGDSFPVVTCSAKRGGKVARELTAKGFCSSKGLHYYGVKIHAIALRQPKKLPFPQYFDMTPACVHDLTAIRNILQKIEADASLFDKAYCDIELEKEMKKNDNTLITPLKDKKGWQAILQQKEQAFTDVFNKAVAVLRQPIESLFNWINERTDIQKASKVRSENGLKLHIFGKLTAAMMIIANF